MLPLVDWGNQEQTNMKPPPPSIRGNTSRCCLTFNCTALNGLDFRLSGLEVLQMGDLIRRDRHGRGVET